MSKVKVGVLGCTGMVGQKYCSLLKDHPYFELTFLAASEKNVGRSFLGREIHSLEKAFESDCSLFFSALPSAVARTVDEKLVKEGKWVISSSSAFRAVPDVPLLIPEINSAHLSLLQNQRKRFGTVTGGLIAKPNCTLQSYVLPLFPLHKKYTLTSLNVTNMQAVSGAGKDSIGFLLGNIDPFIPHEEEKSESEPLKLFATIENNAMKPPVIDITATCVRVPVLHGHTAVVTAAFENPLSLKDCIETWGAFASLELPSAPPQLVRYMEEPHRPQPLHDVEHGNGMGISVGQMKQIGEKSVRFIALSHNVVRGAAGGGVLSAELLYKEKMVW